MNYFNFYKYLDVVRFVVYLLLSIGLLLSLSFWAEIRKAQEWPHFLCGGQKIGLKNLLDTKLCQEKVGGQNLTFSKQPL